MRTIYSPSTERYTAEYRIYWKSCGTRHFAICLMRHKKELRSFGGSRILVGQKQIGYDRRPKAQLPVPPVSDKAVPEERL
jgi:hypothetical protein